MASVVVLLCPPLPYKHKLSPASITCPGFWVVGRVQYRYGTVTIWIHIYAYTTTMMSMYVHTWMDEHVLTHQCINVIYINVLM